MEWPRWRGRFRTTLPPSHGAEGVNAANRMIACQAGIYAANGVNMVFIVVLMAAHGLSTAEIGLVMGLSTLIRVLAGPFWGYLADRIGQLRLVMALGCALTALPLLLIQGLDIQGVWKMAALLLLSNIGSSATMPLADTLTWRNAERGHFTFGHVRAFASATSVAGVVGGGGVVEWGGAASVVWMMAAGNLMTMALLGTVLPAPAVARTWSGALLPLFEARDYRRMLGVSALLQGTHAAFYGFSTLLWQAAHISDRAIGALWGEGVVMEIIVMLLLRHRLARIDPWKLLLIGACVSVLRWTGSALTVDPWLLAILQPLHAGSFTLPYLASMRIIGQSTPPSHAATAQTIYAALGVAAPIGIGMAVVSRIYPSWGGEVFWLMALLAALGLALVLWVMRARRDAVALEMGVR